MKGGHVVANIQKILSCDGTAQRPEARFGAVPAGPDGFDPSRASAGALRAPDPGTPAEGLRGAASLAKRRGAPGAKAGFDAAAETLSLAAVPAG